MPEGFQPEDHPKPAEAVTYFPYMNNRYLAVAASLNGGNVFASFVRMLAQWTAELGKGYFIYIIHFNNCKEFTYIYLVMNPET